MKRQMKVIGVVAMIAMLGACKAGPFGLWGGKVSSADRPLTEMGQPAAMLTLAEGKAQLRDGNLSAAVASFQIARMDAHTAAEANNGLGVAYAKLGRMDLADRYFRVAILLDPADQRFASNLLRLQRDTMLASRRADEVSEVLRVAQAPVPQPVAQLETGRVVRVSRHEVRVASAPEPEQGNAPQVRVVFRDAPKAAVVAAQAAPAPVPVVTVEDKKPISLDKSRTYPVRFVFGE